MSAEEYVPVTPRLRALVPSDMVTMRDFGPPWGRCEVISLRDLLILDGIPPRPRLICIPKAEPLL